MTFNHFIFTNLLRWVWCIFINRESSTNPGAPRSMCSPWTKTHLFTLWRLLICSITGKLIIGQSLRKKWTYNILVLFRWTRNTTFLHETTNINYSPSSHGDKVYWFYFNAWAWCTDSNVVHREVLKVKTNKCLSWLCPQLSFILLLRSENLRLDLCVFHECCVSHSPE